MAFSRKTLPPIYHIRNQISILFFKKMMIN